MTMGLKRTGTMKVGLSALIQSKDLIFDFYSVLNILCIQQVGNTGFLDLTNLALMWFLAYGCMKRNLQIFLGLHKELPIGFFRFGHKFSNLTLLLCM